VARLKQQPGKDILVFGSATLAQSLMQRGLIDEYRLMVFPIVLASGKRLFAAGLPLSLRQVQTQTFSSGVVVLIYRPAEQGGKA
jgi:dihydrofolate reductase